MTPESDSGILYIVPTPIGNLGDITERAQQVLSDVTVIAAEDTRHSGQLLQHLGIKGELLALHDHNERQRSSVLVERLQRGDSIALISDAGTPLISDPGYILVQQCRAAGIRVVALPGACAITTALSAAGLPTDRFCFEGFLTAKPQQRRKKLRELVNEVRTMVFYESPHRIVASLTDFADVLGVDRQAVLARELTKRFETYLSGSLTELSEQLAADTNQQRGEMVLIVAGAQVAEDEPLPAVALATLQLLMAELPLKKAAALTAEIYGLRKNALYEHGLSLTSE